MRVEAYRDVDDYYRRVEPFLMEQEVSHNLLLGILETLRHDPTRYPETAWLLTVEDAMEELVLVALRTPPHHLVLSLSNASAAVEALALYLYQEERGLTGVLGPQIEAHLFAEAWHVLSGQPIESTRPQGGYRVERVKAVSGVAGRMRRATGDDQARVMRWALGFADEVMNHEISEEEATLSINGYLSDDSLYLWEVDGVGPVSMAATSGRTTNGIRVSYVYTPPAQRRHGYASALVAALSQRMLDEGRRFCFLFTELGNPTSNHIYQEIGYEWVGRFDMYRFGTTRSVTI